jgi:hypothetical protein
LLVVDIAMMNCRVLLRFILVLLSVCFFLNACDGCHDSDDDPVTGTLSGLVEEAGSGLPISGATVGVYNGATLLATATTDADGDYSVEMSAGANYEVSVSGAGFIPAS